MNEKPPHCTRIHIQNVNGFTLDSRGGQFDTFCAIHKEIQADISCGQEHKLDTTQMQVRIILYETAQKHWDRSKMTFGTSPIPFSSHYKPGGAFILTTGSATGRVRKHYRDQWGRWVSQEFSGRNNGTVMIISAYQPVEKRRTEGTNSVASQHRSLLLQSSDPTTNPRVAFRRDLLQQLKVHRQDGIEFLLVGDFNEEYRTDPDGISSIASELGLINIMSFKHPHQSAPVTYARCGVKCLDFALGTKRVAESVVSAGYEAFNERFIPDHRGYFFDMDTTKLFGSPTQDLATFTRRQLCTSNAKHNTAYIDKVYELLAAHNVFERAQRLTYIGDRHSAAEAIDKDMTAACLAAERKLPIFGEAAWWSVELASARQRTHVLGKLFSNMKAGRDSTLVIEEARKIMPITWEPPTTIQQSSQQWRSEKKITAKLASESIDIRDKEMKVKIKELEQSCTAADKETVKIIRRVKRAEDLKKIWQKLKVVRQNAKTNHVVRLEIPTNPDMDPKQCTEWQTVEVPTEIVKHLQERNRKHFGQAHGTPTV